MTKHRRNKPAPGDGPANGQAAEFSKPAPPPPPPSAPRLKAKREQEEVKPPSALSRFIGFLKDARRELTRVTWPTRKETVTSTGVLLALVAISAVYLALVDGILTRILRLIVG
ncbi:MAG: preprotein translocase subunit SecE [Deltaproteobacteria bacterium]|jgi:preprotein translocase subunit SecE|nr:preprotein translocase subunit SecE [Deltaproteobacteria bacterium]